MEPTGSGQPVRRSLFGPVDHERLRRDLRLQLDRMEEQDRLRWNFDFQAEAPLSGRFRWEETPARCARAEDDVSPSRGGTDQENRPGVSHPRRCPGGATPGRRKRTRSKPGRDARITDFFSKRKKTPETKGVRVPLNPVPVTQLSA
ncbi:cyclin-dependent kinase inhibitor 1-like [Antennarius striatus]|uniref:cyclin-dependent kinase inhibitor 1-like n=1 Tax=Antennarius striatus TaxID=241820 RepID=UPI0035B09174